MSVLQPIDSPADVVVKATKVTKIYGKGETAVRALRNVDVEIGRGEFTAIMGPSGSGKSTLMHCLAGLDSINQGTITLDDITVSQLSERKLTQLRRDKIGFIFQSFNLIPTLNAEENIKLPADIAKRPISASRFRTIVKAVGIENRLHHRPAELSGGQQQRVACARALATNPAVVFADEPTGNLDSKSTHQVLSFLRHAVDALGQTVVMVTHEPDAAAFADRVLFLVDGQVVAQLRNPQRDTILDALRELGDQQPMPLAEDAPPAATTTPSEILGATDFTPPARKTAYDPLASASAPGSAPTATSPSLPTPAFETEGAHSDSPSPKSNNDHAQPEPVHYSDDAPMPGEPLDVALRRMAPAKELEPETERVLEAAQRVLQNLPGSVIPQDDPALTGQVPVITDNPPKRGR